MDLAEASKDEVLQELTANSSGTDHQNARLIDQTVRHVLVELAEWTDLLDTRVQGTQGLACKPITPHGNRGCLNVIVRGGAKGRDMGARSPK